MTGTAVAQGLAFLVSPILSRMFDPAAFGLFGMFTATCGIISVVSSGKYELAILLPKKDENAVNVLALSVLVVLIFSVLSFVLVFFFRIIIADYLGSVALASILWWAPISVLFFGLHNVFNYWVTRKEQFKNSSVSRITQSVGREGTQLGLGWLSNLQGTGLVIGHLTGQAVSALLLIFLSFKDGLMLMVKFISKKRMIVLAKRYKDFPKYNMPQNFLNSVSQNVPPILLAFFFNPAIVGFYWFTHRILLAPNKLIGGAIRQVYYQKATQFVSDGKSIEKLFNKTTGALIIFALVPLALVMITGPSLFAFVFGEEWFEAGRYARWLVLWWFALFINVPAVMTIPIFGYQKFHFKYEVFLITGRFISLCTGGYLGSAYLSIILFSITGFAANVFLTSFIWSKIKLNKL